MRRALLALLLLISGAPLAAASDALAELDSCIEKLDAGLDVGYQRIAERCPALPAALKESSFSAWLPHDWDRPGNQLSRRGLTDLKGLLVRESQRASSGPGLSVAAVPSILAAITKADQPRSLWQRFKAWLNRLLSVPAERQQDGWLQRLFAQLDIPALMWRVITWAALAVVVALAGAIVINELRLAGVFRPRPAAGAAAPGPAQARRATLAEIGQTSLTQQPRLLLELIATRLAEQARLPPPRALTVRELTRAASLVDPHDRARLTDLAVACERLRYSDRALEQPALEHALAAGRELLSSLDAAAQPLGA
jgi:hypothetical protein